MAGPLECLRTHTPDVQSIIVPEISWHSFCGHLLGGCGKVYELGDGSRGQGGKVSGTDVRSEFWSHAFQAGARGYETSTYLR